MSCVRNLAKYTNPCISIAMNRTFCKPVSISGHRSVAKRCATNAIHCLMMLQIEQTKFPSPTYCYNVSGGQPYYLPNTKPHIRPSTHQSTTTVTTKMAANFNTAILSPLLAIRPNLSALPRIDVVIFENVSLVLSRTS